MIRQGIQMLSFFVMTPSFILGLNINTSQIYMKFTLEKVFLGSLTILLGVYALTEFAESPEVILYRLSELVVFLSFFFFMALRWIGDPDHIWSKKKRWSALLFLGTFSWFLICLTKIVMDLAPDNNPILMKYFFLPHLADNVLGPVLLGLIVGVVYGIVRRAIITKNYRNIKILGAISVSGVIIYGSIVVWNLSYSGTEKVRFLDRDQELISFEEVLSQPELEGKKIYVDFWYSSCGPCIGAFKNMDSGKKLLKEEGYITLYMGRETSHPDSKARWLNVIRDFDLEGYHVYMSKQLEDEMTERVMQNSDDWFSYPHYLLINENGEVINWDAPGIVDIELLSGSISELSTNNLTN